MRERSYQPCNIEKAIETATGFEKLGRLALNSNQLAFDVGIAGGVNLGIAIELNLKIIYYFDKGYLDKLTQSHKLVEIYDELSQPVKDYLLSQFTELSKTFTHREFEFINEDTDMFRGYLSSCEKVCVKWRYYGLDSKNPPKSSIVYVLEFLEILKSQIQKFKQAF